MSIMDESYGKNYTPERRKIPKYHTPPPRIIKKYQSDTPIVDIKEDDENVEIPQDKTRYCNLCSGHWQKNSNERLEKLNG
jgi:hypothetical protein